MEIIGLAIVVPLLMAAIPSWIYMVIGIFKDEGVTEQTVALLAFSFFVVPTMAIMLWFFTMGLIAVAHGHLAQ